MCVHMMNIFLKMIIRKKCFLMLKYRESRTYYINMILFYMKSKYFFFLLMCNFNIWVYKLL